MHDAADVSLRTEFTSTLCIADKLGILDSIERITRQIHRAGSVGRDTVPTDQQQDEQQNSDSNSEQELDPIPIETTRDSTPSTSPEPRYLDTVQEQDSSPNQEQPPSSPQPEGLDGVLEQPNVDSQYKGEQPVCSKKALLESHECNLEATPSGCTGTERDLEEVIATLRVGTLSPNHPESTRNEGSVSNGDSNEATATSRNSQTKVGQRNSDHGSPKRRARKDRPRKSRLEKKTVPGSHGNKPGSKPMYYGMGAGKFIGTASR